MTSQTALTELVRHHLQNGDPGTAERACREAIDAQPDAAAPWVELGHLYRLAGQPDEAISAYREAIGRDNDSWQAWGGLGRVFLDRGLVADARMALKRAVRREPEQVEIRVALAEALQRLGRTDEAIDTVQGTIALRPDLAASHLQLGDLLLAQGRLEEAGGVLRQVLALHPDDARAYLGLGRVAEQAGDLEQAAAHYTRVLELQPGLDAARLARLFVLQRLCDWDAVEAFEHASLEDGGTPPAAALSLGWSAQRQQAVARTFARSIHVTRNPPLPASVYGVRPIIVGYLSADFRDCAVGRLMAPILEHHDRRKVRIAAFSYGPDDGSAVRRRLKRAVDEFVDLRYHTDAAAAREIRTRGVQILVDLTGYGRDSRPEILAMQAAPVQVAYLGYPGTLGAGYSDYLVADDYLLPGQSAQYYDEQALRLPHGVLAVEPAEITLVGRKDCGLPQGTFVFACPEDTAAIGRQVFAAWMVLLRQAPDSVLWFNGCGPQPRARLQAAARRSGIDPDRLVFSALGNAADLSGRYRHADLLLDTFPGNAPASALQALRGGCPVLSCSGESYVSRVTGSVLHSIGMDDMICHDLDAYIGRALELARAPDRLAGVRQRLHGALQTAPLFDVPGFSATLEAAYTQMLEAHARGEGRSPLRIAPA